MCENCKKPSISLHFQDPLWVCRTCYVAPALAEVCRPHEYGHENPDDPKGSTAHVRDIKARRWDPKEKRMFYYQKPKTYFF